LAGCEKLERRLSRSLPTISLNLIDSQLFESLTVERAPVEVPALQLIGKTFGMTQGSGFPIHDGAIRDEGESLF